jgi:hypothetical protein
LDLESIEKGGLFEVRIEQGIRASEVVAAVMTPHSVREESICRDEVAFAINEHKPVVPLLVTPNVQPTLLLARRNWIDFTASYEQGLTALLRFLAGDRAAGLPPRLPTVTGVLPLDFGPEIARYAANFTGREWLFTDLRRWLATQTKPVLVIVGEPGIGKSAIAARLALTWPEVLGIHFCTHRNSRSLDPYEFVGSLVGQLHALLPGFAAVVEARHPEERRLTASDAFRELIVEPTRALPEANAAKLLVIDSLDEASVPSGETVLDVLVRHAEDLPPWLRIVATTRPEARILDQIRTLRCFELRADIPENKADLQQYIQNRLGPAAGGAAARLMELASGNFLYARHALDALGDGTLSLPSLGTLTPGLSAFYRTIFARLFPDMAVYDRDYGPLLRALAAARGPLPLAVFQRLTAAEPESLHRRLRLLRSYLRAIGEGQTAAHTFYHQSLRDWLTNAEEAGDYWLDVRKGHALLAGALADAWPAEEYALRHLPYHLAAARGADDLADLLSTPEFLEAKVEAGLVFGLVKDFAEAVRVLPDRHPRRHILTLLEEAIRRDIHFLARHPTTLFQCLWNSCWWYDCPEAAAHYEVPEEGWQAAQRSLSTTLRH